MVIKHIETETMKMIRSETYNYNFNKKTGFFARWGRTEDDDPPYAPGPEIIDIEISKGRCLVGCKFCYKANTSNASHSDYMTLEQFKTILDKIPKTLTQIAFGITDINSNPDFFPIMEYARSQGVAPNYTCNGWQVTPEVARRTAETCGAVAVSIYHKDNSYNAIKAFTDAGMTQVNIHFMLSEETYQKALDLVRDVATDPRLAKLRAIVFLAYKPKGTNAGEYHTVKSLEQYQQLIDLCEELDVGYGMDSCSAPMYIKAIQKKTNRIELSTYVESCESSLFSGYINVHGRFFHCSFTEGHKMWGEGLDVLNCEDFTKDVWNSPLVSKFRHLSVGSLKKNPHQDCGDCRSCLIFPSINAW